ncbi:hypothetical protein M3G03_08690 [Aestuariimicrobium sp. p3-SID1156]|uniref:MarC family protein n=1 Tax=Aestuariimicrobium sp. p3-SID1156 TaxID=2916038 RepID=UPI00223BD09E|nr:MarC family protein [Aestuariimicrobium sp. p3-SID1156]MCT1459613.1 hypothetical protein [Aestuariimicrobium sp. p3-SID1156]
MARTRPGVTATTRRARILDVMSVFLAAVAALLPITNPVGALAAFAGLTANQPKDHLRSQAIRTGVYVFLILAVFSLVPGPAIRGSAIGENEMSWQSVS